MANFKKVDGKWMVECTWEQAWMMCSSAWAFVSRKDGSQACIQVTEVPALGEETEANYRRVVRVPFRNVSAGERAQHKVQFATGPA